MQFDSEIPDHHASGQGCELEDLNTFFLENTPRPRDLNLSLPGESNVPPPLFSTEVATTEPETIQYPDELHYTNLEPPNPRPAASLNIAHSSNSFTSPPEIKYTTIVQSKSTTTQNVTFPTSVQDAAFPTSVQNAAFPTSVQNVTFPTSIQNMTFPTSVQNVNIKPLDKNVIISTLGPQITISSLGQNVTSQSPLEQNVILGQNVSLDSSGLLLTQALPQTSTPACCENSDGLCDSFSQSEKRSPRCNNPVPRHKRPSHKRAELKRRDKIKVGHD